VLLWQIDRELLDNLASIAAERAKESSVTVHDDESKLLVRLEKLAQCFGMKLVVTQVEGSVDGFEGLKVDVDFALLTFACDNFTTVDDEAIRWDFGVELQTLLGGRDGRQDGETVDAGFDVGGSSLGHVMLEVGT
jgi:hypothetical protein